MAFVGRLDATHAHADDEAIDARIADDEVRAAAQDAERDAARPRPRPGVRDRRFVLGVDEEARGTPDAQRAVGREQDVLVGDHAFRAPGPARASRPPIA